MNGSKGCRLGDRSKVAKPLLVTNRGAGYRLEYSHESFEISFSFDHVLSDSEFLKKMESKATAKLLRVWRGRKQQANKNNSVEIELALQAKHFDHIRLRIF